MRIWLHKCPRFTVDIAPQYDDHGRRPKPINVKQVVLRPDVLDKMLGTSHGCNVDRPWAVLDAGHLISKNLCEFEKHVGLYLQYLK